MIGLPRYVAGLDVGSTKTCAVIIDPGSMLGESEPPEVIGVGHAASAGLRNRTVANIEAATESIRTALREAEDMAGVEVQSVFAGVAGDHVSIDRSVGVVAISGREIMPRDIEDVHEVAQAVVLPPDREVLHAIPQDYMVDGRRGIQDPTGMAATRLESEICVISAHRAACQNLRKAIDRAGYRVEELVLTPLASSLAVLPDDGRIAGTALIEIGGASTELLVFKDERLRLAKSLPWGAATVSNDIVKGLGVPLAEAETLKALYGSAQTRRVDPAEKFEISGPTPGGRREVSRELLAHIIEQRLDEILGLVFEELEAQHLIGELPGGVVLTGGGVELDGVIELAQDVFNMPVAKGLPGAGLGGVVEAIRRPECAAAVGLALYGRHRRLDHGGSAVVRTLSRVGGWIREFF
ncbi:MAG: cell division protein FtsA [Gemmatimonadota bacterium]|jgi:cell division protein FtsA